MCWCNGADPLLTLLSLETGQDTIWKRQRHLLDLIVLLLDRIEILNQRLSIHNHSNFAIHSCNTFDDSLTKNRVPVERSCGAPNPFHHRPPIFARDLCIAFWRVVATWMNPLSRPTQPRSPPPRPPPPISHSPTSGVSPFLTPPLIPLHHPGSVVYATRLRGCV